MQDRVQPTVSISVTICKKYTESETLLRFVQEDGSTSSVSQWYWYSVTMCACTWHFQFLTDHTSTNGNII